MYIFCFGENICISRSVLENCFQLPDRKQLSLSFCILNFCSWPSVMMEHHSRMSTAFYKVWTMRQSHVDIWENHQRHFRGLDYLTWYYFLLVSICCYKIKMSPYHARLFVMHVADIALKSVMIDILSVVYLYPSISLLRAALSIISI